MTDAKFPVPAAQYLRMSTEHQQYSLDNQSAAIQKYAESHGFTVFRTCSTVTSDIEGTTEGAARAMCVWRGQ